MKSHESLANWPNKSLIAGSVALGLVLSPNIAEAAEKPYVSPEEQAILSAPEKLDQVINSPNSKVIFKKRANGVIETKVVNGNITVTKQDGEITDTFSASEKRSDGSGVFETIVCDNGQVSAFVMGYTDTKGKMTGQTLTYTNNSIIGSEAKPFVKDIISLK